MQNVISSPAYHRQRLRVTPFFLCAEYVTFLISLYGRYFCSPSGSMFYPFFSSSFFSHFRFPLLIFTFHFCSCVVRIILPRKGKRRAAYGVLRLRFFENLSVSVMPTK
ncbi:hypothetical protein BDV28DRAFT_54668 [Aspergillus coremiiformis]|uniref:Uncharacterized protein n=1 Tax=Aspergillus coremiiformis TaxID=138285 RepID=A0A5N6YWE8_9EURO|nr:hypothetical protein BDV28DRAFT_54668 [Aspergillus coremiiformis]